MNYFPELRARIRVAAYPQTVCPPGQPYTRRLRLTPRFDPTSHLVRATVLMSAMCGWMENRFRTTADHSPLIIVEVMAKVDAISVSIREAMGIWQLKVMWAQCLFCR